jgi:hypothetical protein
MDDEASITSTVRNEPSAAAKFGTTSVATPITIPARSLGINAMTNLIVQAQLKSDFEAPVASTRRSANNRTTN